MTDSTRFIGPRGWAALVLAGGAALSAPFLRNSGNPPHAAGAAGNSSDADFSRKSWPDVRETSLTPASQIASNLSDQDWAELERLKSNSGAAPRKVTGNLPSTSATPLPSWADRGPRIDQLVNDSIRTEPLAPAAPVGPTGLDPLRPWMGHGMKTNLESSSTPPHATDLSGDFALRTLNPDARWNTVPSTLPNSDALPQDSGVLASNRAANRAVRKFEDHVKQWPDEKLSPSQVAWEAPHVPQSDRNPASPKSIWPPVSQPSRFPVAGPTDRSPGTPAASFDQHPQPDTVSAPMVSSQSGLRTPRPINPTIEAPKPSTTTPRPKHFIQQPSKRA